jgi:hypothetical protein
MIVSETIILLRKEECVEVIGEVKMNEIYKEWNFESPTRIE